MWDSPRLGIEVASPTLQGRLLTIGPPGKPTMAFDVLYFTVYTELSQTRSHFICVTYLILFHLCDSLWRLMLVQTNKRRPGDAE